MSHTPVGGHPQGWEHKLADRSSLPPVPGEERNRCVNQADYATSPQYRYHGSKGSGAMGGREEASGWDGPEGSSVELQSPYGEQPLHGFPPGAGGEGKPAYLRWARTLQDLLEDAEGIKLFQNFVRNAGGLHSDRLDFYFAVQGLRQESQQPKIRQMVSAIYKFLRKSQLTMPEDLRQKVKQWFKDGTNIEPNIFDAMCSEVEKVMMETTYPNFLRSDAYIQYVSAVGHQPVSSGSLSSSSSPCSSTKDLCISNVPSALATLHEGEELATGTSPGPAAPLTPQRLTKDLLMATQKRRLQPETFSSGPFGRKYSVYSHPHLSYAAYCPTSRQDSEIQSLSSGRADSDAVSMSGSSVDGISRGKSEMSRERAHHSRRLRGLHTNAVINKDPDFELVIPRTLRIPKEQMSMMKPEQFAPLLIEKLLKVRREQENQEKLERKLHEGEIDEGAKQAIPPQMVAAAIREKLQLEDDNDQDILDQHVSRVWSDRTPAPRSPPRSPPRRPRDLLSTLSADSGLYDAASLSTEPHQPLFRHTLGRRSLSKKTLTDSGVSVVSEGPPAPRAPAPPVESRILAWMQDGVHSAERYPRRSYLGSRASSAERSGGSRREPAQPFTADPQMPPPPRPHTPTQLDEARRRLTLAPDYHPPRHHAKNSSKTSAAPWTAKETVVMFTFLDEQVPYRTRIPAAPVTLKHFKDYLPRKGNYRYFFKTECEELASKVIQEEISNDSDLLPLFEGKVMARVKNIE